jgi:pyruvate dehydrogenase E2 component (dihydrolipoamide acetyltransferase)
MSVEVLMPRLGWTMETGIFVEWLKKDGEAVKSGDILFTVETDKALNEVECLDDGLLRVAPTAPEPGAVVPVGALLGYILAPGESLPPATGTPAAPAAAEAISLAALTTAPAAEPNHKPATLAPQAGRVRVSPRARRIAAELGIEAQQVTGTGRAGRILERDVRAAAAVIIGQRPAPAAAVAAPIAVTAPDTTGRPLPAAAPIRGGADTRLPLTTVRRRTAERMLASAQATAPVTLTTEVDATELVRLRAQLKNDSAAGLAVPGYNDLLVKLVAHALLEHPALNARLEGDAIVQFAAVHIGLAVDTPRGLLVPVLRDAASKTVRQLASESAALVEQARAGRLGPEALTGSTFSLTNLGMYDIDLFTPIINTPECAILGLGRIQAKQVVIDAAAAIAAERVAIRQMMGLSLTFDHRLVDGAPAARFLQRVKQFIEQPYLWLVG